MHRHGIGCPRVRGFRSLGIPAAGAGRLSMLNPAFVRNNRQARSSAGAGPALVLRWRYHEIGCPTLRDFRSVGTMPSKSGDFDVAGVLPSFSCFEALLRSAASMPSLRKIAKAGAAYVRLAHARIKGGPAPLSCQHYEREREREREREYPPFAKRAKDGPP